MQFAHCFVCVCWPEVVKYHSHFRRVEMEYVSNELETNVITDHLIN